MRMTSIYLKGKLVEGSMGHPPVMNVEGHFCPLVTKTDGSTHLCVTAIPYGHPKGCQAKPFKLLASGQRGRPWHPNLTFP